MHLWFSRITHSLIKRTDAPCDHQKLYISGGHKGPPEIIYFCKFRTKKGLKLCVNSLQIQNFPIGNGTLPPCKPQNRMYVQTLTEKGLEIVHLCFPKIHSLSKRRSAPLRPPEIIYFCKFRPKRA